MGRPAAPQQYGGGLEALFGQSEQPSSSVGRSWSSPAQPSSSVGRSWSSPPQPEPEADPEPCLGRDWAAGEPRADVDMAGDSGSAAAGAAASARFGALFGGASGRARGGGGGKKKQQAAAPAAAP
jgi:hypothetical protein